MEGRGGVPTRQVALDQVRDRAVVLAVRVDQSAVLRGGFEQEDQVFVTDLLVPVGHIDLERREARPDETSHLLDDRIVHVRDDHVEAIVDDGVRVNLREPPVAGEGQ